MMRALLAVTALLLFSGCSGEQAQQTADDANRLRTGSVGKVADQACDKVEDAVPEARKTFDRAREALLRGDDDSAKQLLDKFAGAYAARLSFDVGIALKACQAALG